MGASRLEIAVDVAGGAIPMRLELRSEASTLGISGPSGPANTTLLPVVAGLDRRGRGPFAFGGAPSHDTAARAFVPTWRRGVGWVPQDGVLFPHLSVRENLAFAARVEVEPVADMLGVSGL